RESDDILILPIGEGEDMDVALLRQIPLDSLQMRFEAVLAVAEASIDRELAHLKTFVEQELTKFGGVAHLFLGAHRQVEHHENPHKPISGQMRVITRSHAGSSFSLPTRPALAHSIAVGGTNKASSGR